MPPASGRHRTVQLALGVGRRTAAGARAARGSGGLPAHPRESQLNKAYTVILFVLGLASLSPAGAQPARAGVAATPPGGQAANGARVEAPYWIENAELQATRRPATGSQSSGSQSSGSRSSGSQSSGAQAQRAQSPGSEARPGQPSSPAAGDDSDESPSRGEVFDSADYQHLLLIAPPWPEALVLTLSTGDVHTFPAASVLGEDGRPRRIDPAAGAWVASFTTHGDGRITFGTTDLDYTIEPAAPLVGEVSVQVLFNRQPVYARGAAAYRPDPAMVARLAGIAADVEIVAFFGTWCQVCKKHLPALISTIDHANNPHLQLRPIAVSEDGAEPADWIDACGAGYATPTFVVRIDGEEIGRIEEEPRGSIEANLVQILAGASGR